MTHEQMAQKAQNLLACIQHGLHLHDQQSTAAHLGDRSQYIGLSDIGRALECPRAALCNKVFQRPHPSLQKLLTLQRGHWLEYGIGHAFTSQGLHTLPQLELSLYYNDVPIKAHFDFVLAWATPHPAIRILELKSTQNLPETLYTAYEMQLYGQASLLADMWNEPAFTLRRNDGAILYQNLTMPQICAQHFGITLPTDAQHMDIEAWILCISMDDAKAFGPYQPNTSMQELCINTAQTLWEQKVAHENGQLHHNDVKHVLGFHALCTYCDWNSDCPKFQDGMESNDWASPLQHLDALKEQRTALEAEISGIEQSLKDTYALTSLQGDWINTGTHRFKVTQQKGRRTLNKDNLRQALQETHGDNVDSVLAACEQEGKSFQKLTINKLN